MARTILSESVAFNPGTGTFNFTSVTGFGLKYLTAIVNDTSKQIIYMPARGAGYGYTAFAADILTVEFVTAAMNAGDIISYFYDDEVRQDSNASLLSAISTNTSTTSASVSALGGVIGLIGDATPPIDVTMVGAIDKGTPNEVAYFELRPVNSALVGTDRGIITNSVLSGESATTPGTYVDVKVTAAGAISVSGDVNISDNGGSITVDAASWPLPPDASTETKQDDIITEVSAINIKTPTLVDGSSPSKLYVGSGDFYPTYGPKSFGSSELLADAFGNLNTRGAVLTDEGSYLINFSNSSLFHAIGAATFINGSIIVTGSGFESFNIQPREYIKLDADGETAWAQVFEITNDTQIILLEGYTGSSATGATSASVSKPLTGAGGSIAVASGACSIVSGTTTGAITAIYRAIDYLPLDFTARFSLSARNANQTCWIGLFEIPDIANARYWSAFKLEGVGNTTLVCETAYNRTGVPSASEKEQTTYTLASGESTSAVTNFGRIEILQKEIVFYYADKIIARHRRVLMKSGDILTAFTGFQNATAPSTATLSLDYILGKNYNKLDVGISSDNDMISVRNGPPIHFGSVNVTANNIDFFVVDMSQYEEAFLRISSVGGGATVSFQGSDDPAFGGTLISLNAFPSGGGAPVSTSTAIGHWAIPRTTRYFRFRTTAYTSGTITASLSLYPQSVPQREIRTVYNGTQAVSQSGTWSSTGAAAHSAASSGNPVRIAGRCVTTIDTGVVQGDVSDFAFTTGMQLITKEFSSRENDWHSIAGASGIVNTTTAVTIRAAGAASVRNYLTGIEIANDALGGVTELVIRDGAAGTVIWRTKLQITAMNTVSVKFPTPIAGTAATLMEVALLTAVTGGVYINCHGFQGA